MANLETLELTISANAQSAKQSIDLLTQSLSALAGVVSNAASNMQRLNLQLRTMKTVSEKLPNVGKISGSNKITNAVSNSKYAEEQKKAIQQMVEVERQAMNVRGKETQDIMEQSTKLDLLTMKQKALKMETISMAKEGKLTAKQIADRSMQYQKLSNDIEKLKDTSATTGTAMKTHIESVKKSAGGLLSTIGRIFKTMMIRQAIRKLLQAAKEGLDNYYQYSKKMNLSFSAAMDKVSNKWTQLKNQLGAALGTALASLLPIINAVASAITVVLNTFTALFALLGGSSTYSRAKEGMDGYAASASNAAGAAKEWLAAFDELNVMTKNSGGGGGSATNYANMFEEVELPSWLIEWKPIIEAVLAGVLGATILPAIWDWIKKIFGLFSGSAAENAMDFLLKFVTNNDDFKMPDMGSAATDMVTFGAGAAAAAAALPTVRTEVEKLVGALDGVSLIGSLLGLVGELLAKVLSSISVPITLDTKEYDEFKEKHDKWLKEIDEKLVEVKYDDDIAFVSKLVGWCATDDEKNIDIVYNDDIAFVTRLNLWLKETGEKDIDIVYDDDIAFVTKLNLWLLSEDTKEIKVNITYGLATVLKMAVVQSWVSSEDTKKINVLINYGIATVLKMALLDAWVAKEDTKNIDVVIDYGIATVFKMAFINAWVEATGTKTIYIDLESSSLTSFGKMADAIDAWVADSPTKYVSIILLDNADGINKVDAWVSDTPTKYINLDVKDNTGGGDGSTPLVNVGDDGFVKFGDPNAWWNKSPLKVLLDLVLPKNSGKTIQKDLNAEMKEKKVSVSTQVASGSIKGTGKANKSGTLLEQLNYWMNLNPISVWSKAASGSISGKNGLVSEIQDCMDSKGNRIGVTTTPKGGTISGSGGLTAQIQEYMDSKKNRIGVTTNLSDNGKTNIKTDATDALNGTTFSADLSDDGKKAVHSDAYNAMNGTTFKADISSSGKQAITDSAQGALDGISFTADVTANLTNTSALKSRFKSALSDITLKLKTNKEKVEIGEITAFASGGFPVGGQLFLARERGAEMVGAIGNQTAVANNDQIVEGISKGVSDANAKQNELLREQNSLLYSILQKTGNINIGASAALGRVARQSLDMYGALVGG